MGLIFYQKTSNVNDSSIWWTGANMQKAGFFCPVFLPIFAIGMPSAKLSVCNCSGEAFIKTEGAMPFLTASATKML